MNIHVNLVYVTICWRISFVLSDNSELKLISLSTGSHARKLYENRATEDEPSETDPATSNATARERICQEIFGNRLFLASFSLVSKSVVFYKRSDPRYTGIFNQLYSRATPRSIFYKYTNPYRPQQFQLISADNFHPFKDYLFLCPVRRQTSRDIVLFYVSKEYNVNAFDEPRKPGRFLLSNFNSLLASLPYTYGSVILAEEPATIVVKPGDFNVELHYLRIRKYVQAATNNLVDPLCKLVENAQFNHPDNQHQRLCAAICISSKYRKKIAYPEVESKRCFVNEVAFRTAEGTREAEGDSYHERMTLCQSRYLNRRDGGDVSLFISRAYRSNSVLVYSRNPSNRKIYLENLYTNISILDELNSFDFVED